MVIATTPYTDNQMQPTATTMELGCLLPGIRQFQRIVVPSTTGKVNLVGYGSTYGGGDIGDVQVVGRGAGERVLFLSSGCRTTAGIRRRTVSCRAWACWRRLGRRAANSTPVMDRTAGQLPSSGVAVDCRAWLTPTARL